MSRRGLGLRQFLNGWIITGGGSGGLSTVSHDATLTGNGTSGSPLGVVTTTAVYIPTGGSSFSTQGSGNTISLASPTTIAAGDAAALWIHTQGATPVTPTGWTQLEQKTVTSGQTDTLYWRSITGSESWPLVISGNSAAIYDAMCLVVRKTGGTAALDSHTSVSANSLVAVQNCAQLTTISNNAFVAVWACASNSFTSQAMIGYPGIGTTMLTQPFSLNIPCLAFFEPVAGLVPLFVLTQTGGSNGYTSIAVAFA